MSDRQKVNINTLVYSQTSYGLYKAYSLGLGEGEGFMACLHHTEFTNEVYS